jgi:hypothetical protein
VMSAMRPADTPFRIDLLSRRFPQLKPTLAHCVARAAATGEAGRQEGGGGALPTLLSPPALSEDKEPWFNMEAAWTEVRLTTSMGE